MTITLPGWALLLALLSMSGFLLVLLWLGGTKIARERFQSEVSTYRNNLTDRHLDGEDIDTDLLVRLRTLASDPHLAEIEHVLTVAVLESRHGGTPRRRPDGGELAAWERLVTLQAQSILLTLPLGVLLSPLWWAPPVRQFLRRQGERHLLSESLLNAAESRRTLGLATLR